MNAPKTKRIIVSEHIFDRTIEDPYRWLEDGESTETKRWVSQQNKVYYDDLTKHANPEAYRKQLRSIYQNKHYGLPIKSGNKYFRTERRAQDSQASLYYRRGLRGKKKLIFDPNVADPSGLTAISYWHVSTHGRYVCYGPSTAGDEKSTMYIYDTVSDEHVKETVPYTRYSDVDWLPDESGFYYIRESIPGTVPKEEGSYHKRVMFHAIYTEANKDIEVFGAGRDMHEMYGIVISECGKFLFISSCTDWSENQIHCLDIATGKISLIASVKGVLFNFLTKDEHLFVRTNLRDNNFQVLKVHFDDMQNDPHTWRVLIDAKDCLLASISLTKQEILATFSKNVSDSCCIYNLEGKVLRSLEIPPCSLITGIHSNTLDDEYFYAVSNFFTGRDDYRYNPTTKTTYLFRKSRVRLSEEEYQVSQHWATAHDGVQIPMYVLHRKDITYDGSNPTVVYGYGGFSSGQYPTFLANWIPFLEKGGVFIMTNIRGGDEFGEKWHQDGTKANKINSFHDFISCCEYAISHKITSPKYLAIKGGSNGGLLVGACMLMRPELFKAVVCAVPLLDMVRFPMFLMAGRWVHEYGDPGIKEDFERIIEWSPYHNVKENVSYPSVLFMTADKDGRVDPLHARKMTALMQYANPKNTVFLRTEVNAGHGPGKSMEQFYTEQGEVLAFIEWQLGSDR